MMIVDLTPAQHNRLESIADQDAGAKVVGQHGGHPLIRRSDGRVQRLLPTGRLSRATRSVVETHGPVA